MARAVSTRRKIATTALAWAIGLLIFFPIFWTILTSFKTEAQAINNPPLFWGFDFTLENYAVVQQSRGGRLVVCVRISAVGCFQACRLGVPLRLLTCAWVSAFA